MDSQQAVCLLCACGVSRARDTRSATWLFAPYCTQYSTVLSTGRKRILRSYQISSGCIFRVHAVAFLSHRSPLPRSTLRAGSGRGWNVTLALQRVLPESRSTSAMPMIMTSSISGRMWSTRGCVRQVRGGSIHSATQPHRRHFVPVPLFIEAAPSGTVDQLHLLGAKAGRGRCESSDWPEGPNDSMLVPRKGEIVSVIESQEFDCHAAYGAEPIGARQRGGLAIWYA